MVRLQFAAVLNEKKKRIRELEEEIAKYKSLPAPPSNDDATEEERKVSAIEINLWSCGQDLL